MIKTVDVVGVVLITGVMAAILFPVFAKVRSTSGPSCVSNLKQIGLAMTQYEQDNDGELPRLDNGTVSWTWKNSLDGYMKSHDVYRCRQRDEKPPIGPDGFPISYAANTAGARTKGGPHGPFAPWAYPTGVRGLSLSAQSFQVSNIAHPEWTIAVCEIQKTSSPGFDIDDPFFGPRRNVLFAGHTGGGSYLFVDGHAKHLKPAETVSASANGTGAPINFWYGSRQPLSQNGQAILKAAAAASPK